MDKYTINILYLYQAYDKNIHTACNDCTVVKEKHDVIFIGYAEKDRYDHMNYLAANGVSVHVYGAGWNRKEYQAHNANLHLNFKNLQNKDYANSISCSKIALCFLRKINRDLHTSRSIEIPACKTLMAAERTGEHCNLFTEDREAVYFDTKEELLEKVKYYLENEQKRRKIEELGYLRVIKSDYSYHKMATDILNKLNNYV